MPRRIKALGRVLGPASLATVAYGEIASSLYFALGIVALYALGLTPWVLLAVGALFLVVAVSYAEGTAAIPEMGGAATFVRRGFNDPAGFLTGWALFLDYLIVIALAGLFSAHYLGYALGWGAATRGPWDVVIGVLLITGVAGVWLLGQRRLLRRMVTVAAWIAFGCHLLLAVLGLALLFSSHALGKGVHLGVAPTWSAIAFALPVAMLAYTGLETVANLAAETRDAGKSLPRGLFVGIGAAVTVSVVIGFVGISAFPAHAVAGGPGGSASDLGTRWLQAPLIGITNAFGGHLPNGLVEALRVFIGLTGTLILVAAVTAATSGAGRLAYSLAQHDMLPHAFGTPSRRARIAPISIVAVVGISSLLLVLVDAFTREVRFLASLYSFGVLLTFTAAQLAVIRLRFREPDLERPFRAPLNVRLRGRPVPVAALVGAPLTFAIWIASMATHPAARVAGPIWMLVGAVVYVAVRRARGASLLEQVAAPVADLVPAEEGAYQRILVPLKLGPIGEEVLATAIKLAEEEHARVDVLHVIKVPKELPLDAELIDAEERAASSIAEAKLLADEHGVEVEGTIVRARALGEAIVEQARATGADLIVLGSAPRWRRQSRFFSPTVDYVLRKAPCEVMVVAYPQGVLEEEASATLPT
jgi:basic amino acid/polyamine antiporter, APA family